MHRNMSFAHVVLMVSAILAFAVLVADCSHPRSSSSGRCHPLLLPDTCAAAGPQAVLSVLRAHIVRVTAEQQEKYTTILKYLTSAPEHLGMYFGRQNMETEHGAVLVELEDSLRQRLSLVRLDVLMPWVRLMRLQQLAERCWRLQAAARAALLPNLLLTLNETAVTEENILDNVSGLVDQFRMLFLNYKKVMELWMDEAWADDSKEQKKATINHLLMHDFPPMLAKPLLYLLEDEKREFYHDYPSGYEGILDILRKLRSSVKQVKSTVESGAQWKLLLGQLPTDGSSDEGVRPLTQAQIEMEEEVLSTHIIDMMTGYPEKKHKRS